jgi:two-component system cell cycle response regulator
MADVTALVIDDDTHIHREVEDSLTPHIAGRVIAARGPGEGIRAAIESRPDLILLDINMPDMDGFKVCQILKENAATRDVPILFLTVDTKVDHLARALDSGGVDYIKKPFHTLELQARVRAALRNKQLLDMMRERARIDPLTGLNNRAALDDALAAAAAAHERTGQPVSFLMVDVDRFKQVNDGYGHGVGDEVLRAIGRSIRSSCRPYDTPCRFGGDEFAVIFGQVEGSDATRVAKRLIASLSVLEVPAGDARLRITASGGLVTTSHLGHLFEADDLLKAADAALYEAKRRGRDCLVLASELSRR